MYGVKTLPIGSWITQAIQNNSNTLKETWITVDILHTKFKRRWLLEVYLEDGKHPRVRKPIRSVNPIVKEYDIYRIKRDGMLTKEYTAKFRAEPTKQTIIYYVK